MSSSRPSGVCGTMHTASDAALSPRACASSSARYASGPLREALSYS